MKDLLLFLFLFAVIAGIPTWTAVARNNAVAHIQSSAQPVAAEQQSSPDNGDQAAETRWNVFLSWGIVLPLIGLVLLIWFVSISTSPQRDPNKKPK